MVLYSLARLGLGLAQLKQPYWPAHANSIWDCMASRESNKGVGGWYLPNGLFIDRNGLSFFIKTGDLVPSTSPSMALSAFEL